MAKQPDLFTPLDTHSAGPFDGPIYPANASCFPIIRIEPSGVTEEDPPPLDVRVRHTPAELLQFASVPLGRPVLFDDLLFPANTLLNGEARTIFTSPGNAERGHLMWAEPFAPPAEAGTSRRELGLEVASSGIYARTSGPRVETRAEIRWLRAAGVSAVSQTCDPEIVLAGELGIAYGLVGFPVNYATRAAEHETREELGRLLARSSEVLPGLVLRGMEILREEDLVFDHANVYRVDGGAQADVGPVLNSGV